MGAAIRPAVADEPAMGEPRGWYGSNSPLPPIAGPSPYLPDGRTVDGHTGVPIPCRCRAHDRAYMVGEVICLSTPRGLLKARCERAQNITSWNIGDEPCSTM